jgi:catechol-2,3-dioxygenase
MRFGEVEIKELGHIVLYVKNLERSVHFYRDVLGFRPIVPDEGPLGKAMAFSTGRTHHELLLIEVDESAPHPGTGHRAGLYHFGLKVGDSDDELRDVLATLHDEGVRVVGAADHTTTHSLYLLDPDDNELELYIDVPGVDWKNPNNILAPARQLHL